LNAVARRARAAASSSDKVKVHSPDMGSSMPVAKGGAKPPSDKLAARRDDRRAPSHLS
jgi:hypothetical protein